MMNLIMLVQHNWIVPVLAVFVLLVATTYWPGRKRSMEQHGRIPLEDDN
jgi:cbb3-type cytochrome oxidase subunit 3